jgi:hypothetical protein
VLFLGYYGSITLFPHCHIVNGVTIVHSHPYKHSADPKKSPGHQHSDDEFVLIHLISNFLATFVFINILVDILKTIGFKTIFPKREKRIAGLIWVNSAGLRAPPL